MKNRDIFIAGHFMFGSEDEAVNGQTVKTRNLKTILSNRYGIEHVKVLDTNYFRRHMWKNYRTLITACRHCSVVIIMPTANGLWLLLPLLCLLKQIFGFKLVYLVIGGWLPRYVHEKPVFVHLLKQVDRIYPESERMVRQLREYGLSQCEMMANFTLHEEDVLDVEPDFDDVPIPLCFFSRVMESKGVTEAIQAVAAINQRRNACVCTLDIYGPIDRAYQDRLQELLDLHHEATYCGVLSKKEALPTLSKYYLMLFPTYYAGEGMPGAVVEAFEAGLPVLASDWHDNAEIIQNGKTGWLYSLEDKQGNLTRMLEKLLLEPRTVKEMRRNCREAGKLYSPDVVLSSLYTLIDNAQVDVNMDAE